MTFKFQDHLATGKLLAFRTQNWSSFQIPTVYVIISFLKGQKYRVRNYRFVAKLFLWIATTMKMHKAQNLNKFQSYRNESIIYSIQSTMTWLGGRKHCQLNVFLHQPCAVFSANLLMLE